MLDQPAMLLDQDLVMLLVTGGHGTAAVLSPGLPAVRCGFRTLTADTLNELSPGLVVSGLMGPHFDALDVAERLQAIGYHGTYRIVAGALADPDMVQAEIADAAPGLDVRISCQRG
ncbi:hypothetical protein [Limimaricola hongkongensis]|uniref:Uncharacterized protein n=1 Tax=Limimaricola hongkongensis DSM 17492 TaxID=1122180 RepID=A0A017HCJ1_9RHOB|nr:hypothetical protein [Limimaricola hongkongensis]EYD71883.1 hypothetical protein Lokhon_01954 [Limimaricola hongkongensis DSM 17492]